MSDPDDYSVGWICAIKTEVVAAQAMLDEIYDDGPKYVSAKDNNSYTLGRAGEHRVVIASLPHGEYGTVSAATVARDMVHSFPNVRIGLMVGIGGGAPSPKHDIRLGDVVVSSDVFQYDYGKTIQEQAFQPTGRLDQPPTVLRAAVTNLQATHERKGPGLEATISEALSRWPRLRQKYQRQPPESDRLFHPDVIHDQSQECSEFCARAGSNVVNRPERGEVDDNPAIHYGKIASANQLMKDAEKRDELAKGGVLCFEMEAAGLMNHFPCIAIRGICDYADTHKNKDWQGFAAMAAAAYAKQLLAKIPPNRLETEKTIKDLFDLVQTRVEGIESRFRDDDIYKWLKPSDPAKNHHKACQERHPGSGSWLLQHETFSSWKAAGQSSFLWLYGISGCGKTVLSSTVIEHLRSSCADSPVLYFYFDFSDEKKQELEHLLRYLLYRLGSLRDDCRKLLRELFLTCSKGKRQPSITELRGLSSAMFESAGEIWIVIDALDESRSTGRHNNLLTWLNDVTHTKKAVVRLVATSRPEIHIRLAINQIRSSVLQLSVQGQGIHEDVSAYLRFRLHNDITISRWRGRADVQSDIEAKVLSGSDSMFRLVACRLDSLKECYSEYELQQILRTLPKDLDDVYHRMILAMPRDKLPMAVRILQLLLFSARPLRARELSHAIAVETDKEPYFNQARCLVDAREIAHFCPGLTTLITLSDEVGHSLGPILQLAHLSVKEYLSSGSMASELRSFFDEQSAKLALADVCVSYLFHVSKEIKNHVDKQPEGRFDTSKWLMLHVEQTPFASYCASSWYIFAGFRGVGPEGLRSKIVRFLEEAHPSIYLTTHQMDAQVGFLEHTIPTNALYYASFAGLVIEVREFIARGSDTNTQGGKYGNALQAASFKGHSDVVDLLLHAGANVNAQGGKFGHALQAASAWGHRDVVELLLAAGADVNSQGGPLYSALRAASARGDRAVAEILIHAGADVNAQGGTYGNALLTALSAGEYDIIKLLLDAGADANAQGDSLGDAFMLALYTRDRDMMKSFTDPGIDTDVWKPMDGSILGVAIAVNDRQATELLLKAGAKFSGRELRPRDSVRELLERRARIAELLPGVARGRKKRSRSSDSDIAERGDTTSVKGSSKDP